MRFAVAQPPEKRISRPVKLPELTDLQLCRLDGTPTSCQSRSRQNWRDRCGNRAQPQDRSDAPHGPSRKGSADEADTRTIRHRAKREMNSEPGSEGQIRTTNHQPQI